MHYARTATGRYNIVLNHPEITVGRNFYVGFETQQITVVWNWLNADFICVICLIYIILNSLQKKVLLWYIHFLSQTHCALN